MFSTTLRLNIGYLIFVAGRVSGSSVENSGWFANPRKDAVGSKGKVSDEGRIRSRIEAETQKKGKGAAEENARKVSIHLQRFTDNHYAEASIQNKYCSF